MKRFALVLSLVPVLAAHAQTPSAGGKWKVHQAVGGNESDSICTFVQKDAVLTGSCVTDKGKVDITGSVDGAKVKWAYKSDYNGTALTISFSGTLTAGKIAGDTTVDPFGISGEFAAVPAPESK